MFPNGSLTVLILLLLGNLNKVNGQLEAIRDFIQINIAGVPALHNPTQWDFDPDVSLKRRALFEEVNGVKAEKLIERLGVGIDGKEKERRQQQKIRDQGHLGGLNYFQP